MGFRDGSIAAAFRAAAPPGVKLRTDDELDRLLGESLVGRDPNEDLFVFAYGSLMWNPALNYVESMRADLRGWSRRFCIRMYMGRGTPDHPGLMLALDRGGACRGMVFRIAASHVQEELRVLWRREMLSGTYLSKWVTVLAGGHRVRALTFIVNRKHERYEGRLSAEQVAHFVATGKGSLGSCSTYFRATLETLTRLGIKDAAMERLRRALSKHETHES